MRRHFSSALLPSIRRNLDLLRRPVPVPTCVVGWPLLAVIELCNSLSLLSGMARDDLSEFLLCRKRSRDASRLKVTVLQVVRPVPSYVRPALLFGPNPPHVVAYQCLTFRDRCCIEIESNRVRHRSRAASPPLRVVSDLRFVVARPLPYSRGNRFRASTGLSVAPYIVRFFVAPLSQSSTELRRATLCFRNASLIGIPFLNFARMISWISSVNAPILRTLRLMKCLARGVPLSYESTSRISKDVSGLAPEISSSRNDAAASYLMYFIAVSAASSRRKLPVQSLSALPSNVTHAFSDVASRMT